MRKRIYRAWLGNEARPGSNEFMIFSENYKCLSKFFSAFESRLGTHKYLMEFTSFKDINGNMLFEGDVISTKAKDTRLKEDFNAVIDFSFGAFTAQYIGAHKYLKEDLARLLSTWVELGNGVERIGNIHENPELLKG